MFNIFKVPYKDGDLTELLTIPAGFHIKSVSSISYIKESDEVIIVVELMNSQVNFQNNLLDELKV